MNMIKHNIKVGLVAIILLAVIMRSSLIGKEVSASSDSKFHRLIRRNELVVVYFYYQDKKDDDRAYYYQQEDTLRMFRATSSIFHYKDADVMFITVNLAKRRLHELAYEFNIQEQQPTYMLFQNGIPVREKGNIVKLTGFISQKALRDFIDRSFDDRINEISEEKEEIRKRRIEELRYRAYYDPYDYYYPYYYRNWPYYSYPYRYGYGYPYGGWGWSFGFGGRYRW